ncbi:MAG: hypothetical protein AL399_04120 [Candidatus [Bacteroides] periocalifornicus]|jgi:hypothetical protein|uniref:Spermatogenesis-associated protein 20-like TRX domain-containing protein n=1 Tax=Candidatus [Bacteroides] periocalifornicus TaxID=1702214 RepID=A0A0Q4B7N1_9BACT|nr:MAG: hypothetical protein AL399_04120 [Candidatus [Bacteroides] periocalifornicus]
MKRITLIAILLGTILLGSGALLAKGKDYPSIKWITFEEAAELCKTKPRPILVDMYTDWCGWCKKLDAYTFTNKIIAGYIDSTFYAVKFNAEGKTPITFRGQVFDPTTTSERTHPLAVYLSGGQLSYPFMVFLDSTFNVINTLPGYYPPSNLEPVLHYFGEGAYRDQKWEDFQSKFKGSF